MSQVANTFWDSRVERVSPVAGLGAERVRGTARVKAIAKRKDRSRLLVDAVILTIVLASGATCTSIYLKARGELDAARTKHSAASEKFEDLTIKVQKLERDVNQLRTDSRVIEQFARQKFGFVRAGDVVIKVAEPGELSGLNEERGLKTEGVAQNRESSKSKRQNGENRPVRMATLTSGTSGSYTAASN